MARERDNFDRLASEIVENHIRQFAAGSATAGILHPDYLKDAIARELRKLAR